MKTIPLWRALSGAPLVEPAREVPILGAKFAKIGFPVGKNVIWLPCTRDAADAIQKAMTLEVVDYGND